jgi:CubicO group peptidase (beta-lactamase class C family)
MNKILCATAFFCLALGVSGNRIDAATASPSTTQKSSLTDSLLDLDAVVSHAMDAFNVPGVAIGVVVDGKVILAKGYGLRNVDQRLPVTQDTLFAIGSCTKAFTTFMLGQLVDEGKITWEDPVVKHIPEFRLMDQNAAPQITIRDLVAHRSGLARHDLLWANPAFTRSDIIKSLPHLEPACGLRENFQYNNLMYTVAGLVIEKVSGQTWEEAVSSRILIPLAMMNSNSSVKDSQKCKDFSMPYEEVDGEITAIPFRDLHSIAPAGAINSSVSDMVKWIQLQMSDGTLLGKRHICKDTLQEMHTIQMHTMNAIPDEGIYNFGYGLGWCTGIYRGQYWVYHDGGIDGFISEVSLLPHEKIGVVVLSNSSSGGESVVSSLSHTILDRLLGKPSVDWIEKTKNEDEQWKTAQRKEPIEDNQLHSTPSHTLDSYVGTYEHPAYGAIHVKLENNQLLATYGGVNLPLSHTCYDIFKGSLKAFGEKGAVTFSFENDSSGDICEVRIPLEKQLKPIVFKRTADHELLSKEYLQQFEGTFGCDSTQIEVSLRGNSLFIISPDIGLKHELVPDRRLKFGIKGLTECRVQFSLDNDGRTSGFAFVDPLNDHYFKINNS